MIQLVTERIMAQLANLTSAHEMWVFLKENYYADTSFSFVHQMQKMFTLQNSFDKMRPIGDFIRSYGQGFYFCHPLRLFEIEIPHSDEAGTRTG